MTSLHSFKNLNKSSSQIKDSNLLRLSVSGIHMTTQKSGHYKNVMCRITLVKLFALFIVAGVSVNAYTGGLNNCSPELTCISVPAQTLAPDTACPFNATSGERYYYSVSSCAGDSFNWFLTFDGGATYVDSGAGPTYSSVDSSYIVTSNSNYQPTLMVGCSNAVSACQLSTHLSYDTVFNLRIENIENIITFGFVGSIFGISMYFAFKYKVKKDQDIWLNSSIQFKVRFNISNIFISFFILVEFIQLISLSFIGINLNLNSAVPDEILYWVSSFILFSAPPPLNHMFFNYLFIISFGLAMLWVLLIFITIFVTKFSIGLADSTSNLLIFLTILLGEPFLVPIIRNMLTIFACDYHAQPISIINPDIKCWSGIHWIYVIMAASVLLSYYLLGIRYLPAYQNLLTDLDIFFEPNFLIIWSQLKVVLIIGSIFISSYFWIYMAFLILINLGMLTLLKIKDWASRKNVITAKVFIVIGSLLSVIGVILDRIFGWEVCAITLGAGYIIILIIFIKIIYPDDNKGVYENKLKQLGSINKTENKISNVEISNVNTPRRDGREINPTSVTDAKSTKPDEPNLNNSRITKKNDIHDIKSNITQTTTETGYSQVRQVPLNEITSVKSEDLDLHNPKVTENP